MLINFEFVLKFDLLKLNFESNYNFYWKKDRLILIDNFIDLGSIINIKLFFSLDNIDIDYWKDNFSILKLEENEIEEHPKIKYSYEIKSFDIFYLEMIYIIKNCCMVYLHFIFPIV